MLDIIYKLKKNKNSEPFLRPISQQKNPDYYKIIKEPMDIYTVENNVKKCVYANLDEMAIDIYKIFNNAKKYNKEDSDIYKKAQEMEDYFKKKHNKSPLNNDINQLQKKVDKLGKELKEYHSYGGRFFYKENRRLSKQAIMERAMTLEEKQQLSKRITSLPQEYLIGVWEIITDRQFCIADINQLELDLDEITPKQSRRLERYVKVKLACIRQARLKKKKKRIRLQYFIFLFINLKRKNRNKIKIIKKKLFNKKTFIQNNIKQILHISLVFNFLNTNIYIYIL
ncbi:hypothetical protein IMG5_098280 [Ichthyophthirius multifiliis]|uniref:Histone acetyltransferase n=1 Tax=Ichthyophthirius multifiliis TaxID=5932 RepID=G0QRX2_ICHMU|nr:hypothetical protein IMG5_098280 [Ichthyophthirius multifiliis]EGR32002.1 hypothetical protein IMG5_098280 [Ichthyophthirius multifiliis]|eukprot:XP_004035488.1 hypothetical protein IMG5_098280 [Ichthyophthirius multifiliis]